MWRITQPLQTSRNLSFPYQLLSVLTAILLTLEENKSHVVDVGSNKSHVVDVRTKQKTCCWCQNKTKGMLLMPEQTKKVLLMQEQNKKDVVDVGFYQNQVRSLACLVCPWGLSQSLLVLRLDWCDPDVWRFTQPLQKSRNLSLLIAKPKQVRVSTWTVTVVTLNKVEVGLKNSIKFKGSMPWVIIKTLQFCCHIISLQSMRFSDYLIRKTH